MKKLLIIFLLFSICLSIKRIELDEDAKLKIGLKVKNTYKIVSSRYMQ